MLSGLIIRSLLAGPDAASSVKTAYTAQKTLWESQEPGAVLFKQACASAVASCFALAGRGSDPVCHFYANLAKRADWMPTFDAYLLPAVRVLGRNYEQVKQAGILPPIHTLLAPMATRAAVLSPSVLRALLIGAGGTGMTAGALYWLLNRSSQSTNADIESLKGRTQVYKQLAGEIESELRDKRTHPEQLRRNETQAVASLAGVKEKDVV
jgi:hypothetical protein